MRLLLQLDGLLLIGEFTHYSQSRLTNLVHEVGKGETEVLSACALHLRRLSQYGVAADVYEKMSDIKSLANLYVETHQWENVSRVNCIKWCVNSSC